MIMQDKKLKYLMLIEFIVTILAIISVFMCVVLGVCRYQIWILDEMDVRTLCIMKQLKTIEVNQQHQMDEMRHSAQVLLHDWQQTKNNTLTTEKAMHRALALEKSEDAESQRDISRLQVASSDETYTQSKPLSPQK